MLLSFSPSPSLMSRLAVALALAGVVSADAPVFTLWPPHPEVNVSATLTWTGGTPPFHVSVFMPEIPDEFDIYYGSDTSTSYNFSLPEEDGADIYFQCLDSTGNFSSSPTVTVLPALQLNNLTALEIDVPITMQWSGGLPPYTIYVSTADLSKHYWTYTGNDTSQDWTPYMAAGIQVVFQVIDSNTANVTSDPVTVQPNPWVASQSTRSVASLSSSSLSTESAKPTQTAGGSRTNTGAIVGAVAGGGVAGGVVAGLLLAFFLAKIRAKGRSAGVEDSEEKGGKAGDEEQEQPSREQALPKVRSLDSPSDDAATPGGGARTGVGESPLIREVHLHPRLGSGLAPGGVGKFNPERVSAASYSAAGDYQRQEQDQGYYSTEAQPLPQHISYGPQAAATSGILHPPRQPYTSEANSRSRSGSGTGTPTKTSPTDSRMPTLADGMTGRPYAVQDGSYSPTSPGSGTPGDSHPRPEQHAASTPTLGWYGLPEVQD